jgi:L-fuconolactonase
MAMWTRRDVLQFGVAAPLGACAATAAARASANALSAGVVDTHTHFYDPARPEGVPWPGKDDQFLYRTVLPDDYRRLAGPIGVIGTVVVEASPWIEDNQWILDLAANDPFLLGLVGNLAPGSPEFARHFVRFARNRLFLGIRLGSGSLAKGLDDRAYLADVQRLALAGLTLDVNGGPELLPLVDRLATKFPGLRIVINHLANVRIDGKVPPQDWAVGMHAVAKHPHVFCKVSALVEGASRPNEPSPTDVAFYKPVLDHAWKTLGEDRLLYGSNWPVSQGHRLFHIAQESEQS